MATSLAYTMDADGYSHPNCVLTAGAYGRGIFAQPSQVIDSEAFAAEKAKRLIRKTLVNSRVTRAYH